MKKTFSILFSLIFAIGVMAQPIGRIDKKTKEFYIPSDLKMDYQVFGYQVANNASQKMICFSSHIGDVKDNYNRCTLGSYIDTGKMRPGDKISYLGKIGTFGKMLFVSRSGKKTIFYLPKSSFALK
jgi:hypothetical protein